MNHPPLRLPLAFTSTHRVLPEEIDEYAHVNNAVYLQWLDRIAWTHAAELGTPLAHCLAIRRGMAVRHTRIDYLEAALLGDALLLATWLVACDGRLRCTRRFEIVRSGDGKRVADAEIEYFCLNLDTGKPCRFPREFADSYRVIPEVAAAYLRLRLESRHVGYSGAGPGSALDRRHRPDGRGGPQQGNPFAQGVLHRSDECLPGSYRADQSEG